MPLKLYPPDAKHPTWRVRGTYIGVHVDRSTGSREKSVAQKIFKRWQAEIERGAYAPAVAEPKAEPQVTFAAAALSYMQAGGDATYLTQLIEWFGKRAITDITQADVDAAAAGLLPDAAAPTRNRQVYTPLSAVMHHAGVPNIKAAAGGVMKLRRPPGAEGRKRLFWLKPDQASRFFGAAVERAQRLEASIAARVAACEPKTRAMVEHSLRRDATTARRFHALCVFLLYTGCRISEALRMTPNDVHLSESYAFCGITKNGDPRGVHLPPVVIAALANIPFGDTRVFGVAGKCGRLYIWLDEVMRSAGVELPQGVAFHVFRHTYGAWMRRYGGVDTSGLVATGAWRSRNAAAVYEHAETTEEAQRADLLPAPGNLGETWEKPTKSRKAQ